MKEKQDYIRDIAEIRAMMERSSKFLSLSGWAGVMAGIYALAGAYVISKVLDFNPDRIDYVSPSLPEAIFSSIVVLILAVSTAVALSYKKAIKRSETIWNAASRQLSASMAVPLLSGGVLILVLIAKDLTGLAAPLTMVFYGLALYNASKITFDGLKYLGIIQVVLGLTGTWFIEYSLILWAAGFGIFHIIYGIYMHFRYER